MKIEIVGLRVNTVIIKCVDENRQTLFDADIPIGTDLFMALLEKNQLAWQELQRILDETSVKMMKEFLEKLDRDISKRLGLGDANDKFPKIPISLMSRIFASGGILSFAHDHRTVVGAEALDTLRAIDCSKHRHVVMDESNTIHRRIDIAGNCDNADPSGVRGMLRSQHVRNEERGVRSNGRKNDGDKS